MWHQLAAEEAVAGVYASGGRHEHTDFESYLTSVKKESSKMSYLQLRDCYVRWPEIEGRPKCVIKFHSIEKVMQALETLLAIS